MKHGLSDTTLHKIRNVLSHYPNAEQAILYGSRAKGNYKHGSDIDITLVGNNLTLTKLFRIIEELDELNLPYTIDLSILNDIRDNDLIDHIHRVGVSIYTKSEAVSEPGFSN